MQSCTMREKNMIGVFDSGIGGLSILKKLSEQLPQYSYTYLADSKAGPYGDKSEKEITELTKRSVEKLLQEDCKLVILACNTASACALRPIQQEWLLKNYPDRKVLGILVPTIEQITGTAWGSREKNERSSVKRLGIFATPSTVKSGAYKREISKRAPGMQVFQEACSGLATAIENEADENKVKEHIKHASENLLKKANGSLDAVLLGCTHYALVHHLFEEIVPESIEIFDQPEVVAKSFIMYLAKHPEIEVKIERGGDITWIATREGRRQVLMEHFEKINSNY